MPINATSADVIVIGAGVIGTATALELSRKGFKTLSIDANGEAGHGSTSGSCAIIRVHYSTFAGTALAYEAYHYWRDWKEYLGVEDERGLAEFLETGCVVMKTEANNHLKTHAKNCDELGIPYEHWDQNAVKARLPCYQFDCFSPAKRPEDKGFAQPTGGSLIGGIYFPTAGYVTDPALSSHNLQRAAEHAGASFRFNARIVNILESGGRVAGVELASGEIINAAVVINVGGPASRQLNEMAGVTSDMAITTRALKQEVVHLDTPENYFANDEKIVVSDSDISAYSRSEKTGQVLIGSEDPPCDEREWVDDVYDDSWRDFTAQWDVQAMRQAQRVPELEIPRSPRGVVDLYDVTEDWIPIYDKSSLPGFYMACGSSGNQYKNAPVAGKMMAALVEYCENGGDHDANPLTLELPYIDQKLDIGFFSRNRQINKESSFSVLG